MKRNILCGACGFLWLGGVFTLWAVLLAGKLQKEARSENATTEATAKSGRDWTIGEPIRHENLTVFPIVSISPKYEDRFITLDEGLKAGTVEIMERGAAANGGQRGEHVGGNRVNEVLVLNKSSKLLYLMPGEIIIGGAQDRTIGGELVIPPGKTPVTLEVYCVEHGRWGGRDVGDARVLFLQAQGNQTRASSVTLNGTNVEQVAKEGNEGKFIGSVGNLNKAARRAVQSGEGQQAVWDEVSKANGTSGVRISSGAFTGQYAEGDAVKRLEPYIEKLQEPVANTEQVIGVIVAVNGKIDSLDVFESTPLFQKLWPKLLKSYALDAANKAAAPGSTKAATREDAEAFVRAIETASNEKTTTKDMISTSERRGNGLRAYSAGEEGASRGFGNGIHVSGAADGG